MNYKSSFADRNKSFNFSELKCEEYLKINKIPFTHFGWTKEIIEKMNIGKDYFDFDILLKKQPDYLICKNDKFFLLECKSFDKDHYVRLKNCDIDSYKYWNNFIKVYLFIYSYSKNYFIIISLEKIIEIISDFHDHLMPDNNEPYKIISINKLIEETNANEIQINTYKKTKQ